MIKTTTSGGTWDLRIKSPLIHMAEWRRDVDTSTVWKVSKLQKITTHCRQIISPLQGVDLPRQTYGLGSYRTTHLVGGLVPCY
jgi:hypothetical protein